MLDDSSATDPQRVSKDANGAAQRLGETNVEKPRESSEDASQIEVGCNSLAHGEAAVCSGATVGHSLPPCSASEASSRNVRVKTAPCHRTTDQQKPSETLPSVKTGPHTSSDDVEKHAGWLLGKLSRIVWLYINSTTDYVAGGIATGARQSAIAEDAVRIFSKYIAKEAPHPIKVTDELRSLVISRSKFAE